LTPIPYLNFLFTNGQYFGVLSGGGGEWKGVWWSVAVGAEELHEGHWQAKVVVCSSGK